MCRRQEVEADEPSLRRREMDTLKMSNTNKTPEHTSWLYLGKYSGKRSMALNNQCLFENWFVRQIISEKHSRAAEITEIAQLKEDKGALSKVRL